MLVSEINELLYNAQVDTKNDISHTQRYIKNCKKTKKHKEKNEEGKKVKVKETHTKAGYKYEEKRQNVKLEGLNQNKSQYDNIITRIETGCITEDDIKIIDELIYKNKYNIKFEISVLVFIILIIAFFIVSKFI